MVKPKARGTVKKALAEIGGIPPARFVQVKSPFRALEITEHYDPSRTVLVFVRSEKDRNTQPIPGGNKRNGSPSYLQPWTGQSFTTMDHHAYIDYLKTVAFQAGDLRVTSASEIRKAWPNSSPADRAKIVTDLYPRTRGNSAAVRKVMDLLDQAIGGIGEAAGVGAVAKNAAQARDPRYSTSLTKDVRPNTLNKELAAFFPTQPPR